MPSVTFWYDFASTYSYIAAHRVETVAAARRVDVVWRPFLLGPIFAAQGLTDSPFNLNQIKGDYMWRDMARLAQSCGIPFNRPATFPQNSLLACRVAIAAGGDGNTADVTRAIYAAEFGEGRAIASAEDLTPILTSLGMDAEDIIARATSPETKQVLRDNTDAAAKAGVFGAPAFTTEDGEIFWGSDRLDQAVEWAADHAQERNAG